MKEENNDWTAELRGLTSQDIKEFTRRYAEYMTPYVDASITNASTELITSTKQITAANIKEAMIDFLNTYKSKYKIISYEPGTEELCNEVFDKHFKK